MRTSGRVRLGIIGTGKMGEQHAVNACRFAAGAELVALQDADRSRAERVSAACGGPRVFDDAASLIASKEVDALLIAAPDHIHAGLVLACIEAGKSVLCEKPLAAEAADAMRVIKAEVASGKRLVSLGFMRRFDPRHVAVKNAASSGAMGRPLLWKGVHRNARTPYNASGPFILVNSAGHDIDSARWLLGEEVLDVSVRGLRSRPELAEDSRDLLLLQMTMTGGCLATAEIFMNAEYGYEVSAELVGQLGTVATEQPDLVCLRAKAQRGVPVAPDWNAPFQEAYLAELCAWVESVREGQSFVGASAWDGYVAMTVSAAASRSLLENCVCPVELPERPALYGPLEN